MGAATIETRAAGRSDDYVAMNNWTEISIPCCVRYLSDVTLMTSSLRNYPKMLEIEFSKKRVSWIFNISKIKKTAATDSLYIERPSYLHRTLTWPLSTWVRSMNEHANELFLDSTWVRSMNEHANELFLDRSFST